MQDLNTIPSVGTFGEVARNANTNFSLLKIAVDLLEHSIEHSRGYFTSASALTSAFPSPVVGDWAIVEVSGTPTIYKCSTRGTWSNSGTAWAGGSVDLTEYLKKGTGDNTPSPGSTNFPTSGGVHKALESFREVVTNQQDATELAGEWFNRGFTAYSTLELDDSGRNGTWHLIKKYLQAAAIRMNLSQLTNGKVYRISFNVQMPENVKLCSFAGALTETGGVVQLVDFYSQEEVIIKNGRFSIYVEKTTEWKYIYLRYGQYNDLTYPVDVVVSDFNVSEVEQLKNIVETTQQDISKVKRSTEVELNDADKYIRKLLKITSDGTIENATSSVNRTLVYDISSAVGETVKLSGVLYAKSSAGSYCWWAIHDANGNVLQKSEVSTDSVSVEREDYVTIPEGSQVLYVQGSTNSKIPSIWLPISKIIKDFDGSFLVDVKKPLCHFLIINGSGEVYPGTNSNNLLLQYNVSNLVGKSIIIHGRHFPVASGKEYCWWAIHDVNGTVLLCSDINSSSAAVIKNENITIPEGGHYLYVQGSIIKSSSGYDSVPFVTVPVNSRIDSNIITRKKFKLNFSCLNATSGKIAASNLYTNIANKHTVEYIKIHDSITLHNLNGMKGLLRVFFYDENLSFIQSVPYQDSENGLTELNVEIIPGAYWFRISFSASDSDYDEHTSDYYYSNNHIEISSEWDGNDTRKEPYKEYTPFLYAVTVNVPCKIDSNPSIVNKTLFAYDEGLVHLPPTYTSDGAPTPVIFYIHGDAERYSVGESRFSGHIKMQQCWSDAGFAQVDLDLIPSCYGVPSLALTGGTRDDLECLSAAWTYLCEHFNVDTRGFYLIGRSRGGQAVVEILAKGGATMLPIIAAVSMAGANSMLEYSCHSVGPESEWQLWCDAHGLPAEGRPHWSDSASYATSRNWLVDESCYNFVSSNWAVWWRKALTGWGMITSNPNNISPRDYFDNVCYQLGIHHDNMWTSSELEEFYMRIINSISAKSPVPLRFDWCVGDNTQKRECLQAPHSYATLLVEVLLNTPASNAEYRRWDGVDEENPYGETDPHYAENMIFYSGDIQLPNGVITHNPSKVTMEWLIWCMGHDPRFQNADYSLPWDS